MLINDPSEAAAKPNVTDCALVDTSKISLVFWIATTQCLPPQVNADEVQFTRPFLVSGMLMHTCFLSMAVC